jgi:proline iminopeptidase
VIRWDQRGGGRSARQGPYTIARTLADLDAVRIHFGLPATAVLGHSWGATVALMYALAHPDRVSSLVYVAGTGLGHEWRREFRENLDARLDDRNGLTGREAAVRRWTTEFVDRSRAPVLAERMATPWYGVNEECNTALSAEWLEGDEDELVEACRELDVPTLIVDGAADLRPRWAVDSLADALPDVARVVLPNAGHVPWLEAPGSFGWAVLAHLAQ